MNNRSCQLRSLLFLFLVPIFALSSCATSHQVFTDYDKHHSFEGYSKFSWLTEHPATVEGDLPVSENTISRFNNAIQVALERRAFVYTRNKEDAHFLISYTLGARSDAVMLHRSSAVYENKENWLWGKRYHPHIFPISNDGEPLTYTKGVLGIDVYDVAKMAPVWHARASRRIRTVDLTSDGGNVELAVNKMLESFPPR